MHVGWTNFVLIQCFSFHAGLYAVPQTEGDHDDFVGYCYAELFHRDGKRVWQSDAAYFRRDIATGPNDMNAVHLTWDQVFEWTFDTDTLAFLQYVSPIFHPFC